MTKEPLKIVITPVRNEEWVLDAFLAHTSSWADYIIIADHHSTDRSREIAKQYEKVILIDNPDKEFYANRVRSILLKRANDFPGDKIIFALDADEFLSDGFAASEGWNTILESKPNSIFCFRWLNLYGNFHTVQYDTSYMEWACHFDDSVDIVKEYVNREHNAIHESRLPCLETSRTEYILIDDIRFIHLSRLNKVKQINKSDFYQVSWLDKNTKYCSPISFYRGYTDFYPKDVQELPNDIIIRDKEGKNLNHLVKTANNGLHYIDEIINIINREGIKKFLPLFIWDNAYLQKAFPGVAESRPFYMKAVNSYLKKTQPIKDCILIKIIDKVLKEIYH